MSKQQLKIFIMTIIVGAFLALLGTTYAYYQVRIIENEAETSISVTSKTLEVIYVDGTGVFSGSTDGYIFPGETFTKFFTVKNTGEDIATYNIVLKNVINTFFRTQDWTYTLGTVTDTNSDGVVDTKDQINYLTPTPVIFPTTTEQVTIYENISLAYQANETYVLTVYYANSEEDQSIDMNQELTATVDIASNPSSE